MWWEPGSIAHVHPGPVGRLAPIYCLVAIDQITGHRATPDPPTATPPAIPAREEGWLGRLLHFVP